MIEYFRIGKIITVFGIKGEVKIFPTTDNIKRYDDLKSFYLSPDENADEILDKTEYIVESVKYVKSNPIIKIKDINKIEDARLLIGKNLYVSRENAYKLKNDEYYIGDLLDTHCMLKDKNIGNVKDILKTKANSIIVLESNGKEILIPMVSEYVEKIDINKKEIILKTIEGL